MPGTYVLTLEELAEWLLTTAKGMHGFTHAVLGINTVEGSFSTPSKRNPNYRLSMFLAGGAFKSNHLANIIDGKNVPCVFVLVPGSEAGDLNMPPKETRSPDGASEDPELKRDVK